MENAEKNQIDPSLASKATIRTCSAKTYDFDSDFSQLSLKLGVIQKYPSYFCGFKPNLYRI